MNIDLGIANKRPGRLVIPLKGASPLPVAHKGHILLVEDEEVLRDSLGPFLESQGYQMSLADNGRTALQLLDGDKLPDLILLDLAMPVMDGWEFRLRQKDDPRLGVIPVVALSADTSAQAAAISAQAYLRKPVHANEIVDTIERVLLEARRRELGRASETERLAALGRMAAGVGHEINNPLAFVLMNLSTSIETLGTTVHDLKAAPAQPGSVDLRKIAATLSEVADMLEDSRVGADRIRKTIDRFRGLSREGEPRRGPVDINELVDQSVSIVWNQLRHRAVVVRHLGPVPRVWGDETLLGQMLLNLLVNAAQAIPEGDADHNEIEIVSREAAGPAGAEVVIEVRDSGVGIAPDLLSHVFEPFFTTKPVGEGTGLGLSLGRQAVIDHGGRMTVESALDKGTVFRVFLPVGAAVEVLPHSGIVGTNPAARGRVLVIDDEPAIGTIIERALKKDHDVLVFQRASEAVKRLERGETFDLVLCDVVMPDMNGSEFYTTLAQRWPQLLPRTVFMTGGAFTPATVEFVDRVSPSVLSKPFSIETLRELVWQHLRRDAVQHD